MPLFALVATLVAPFVAAEPGRWQTNMPQGVTEIGHEIYGLHMLIFGICVAVGIFTFVYLFYSLYAYRKSRGAKAANFHENLTAEITCFR